MDGKNRLLIDKLNTEKKLAHDAWISLLSDYTEEDRAYAQGLAAEITAEIFGSRVYFRGLIEFSNICKNDCLYCGIRRSNKNAVRYCLTAEEILMCCEEGYRLGFRTFVLQSGENSFRTSPEFTELIREIRKRFPDCAVTLSVGELSRAAYEEMFRAGADRYLLRHETADEAHYKKLHPAEMSFENRMRCLRDLKEIGFQTGCGMMVGTPGQSAETIAEDMEFMQALQPAMVGIGPFLPHRDTPFKDCPAGSTELTLFLLSLTRIMLPKVLLPATTALETGGQDGRIRGILAGSNVVMPNLSPENVRRKYMLYDGKAGTEESAEEALLNLKNQMRSIGREAVTGRGDHPDYERNRE